MASEPVDKPDAGEQNAAPQTPATVRPGVVTSSLPEGFKRAQLSTSAAAAPEQYCVYEDNVADAILEVARSSHAAALKAKQMYPDCDIGSMFSNAAHRAATIAHNAAVGKPLDRLSRTDPTPETAAAVPECGSSPTPRTDRFMSDGDAKKLSEYDWIAFARQLERELAEAKLAIEGMRGPLANAVLSATPFSRSAAALPANIRKTLEDSNLPIEVATAIADLCEARSTTGALHPKVREALEWYANRDMWIVADDLKSSEIRAGNPWEPAEWALEAVSASGDRSK